MKSIEIATAHNIVVTQELANLGQRIGAFLLDAAILGVYSGLVSTISGDNTAILYLGIAVVLFFYHLFWEIYNNGQTPGKKVMRIRVVSTHGIKPTLQELLLRWAFRLIDISFSLGSMAILSIVTSPKNQRIGDILAGTTVITLQTSRQVDLKSLQQIGDHSESITFPDIVRYNDADMLLVKQTIQRYQQEQNEANTSLIIDLSNRIASDLGLVNKMTDPVSFLKKALADYIVLTR